MSNQASFEDLAEQRGLELLVLFGSRARGDSHSGSDIDVAYLATTPLSLELEAVLAVELGERLRGPIDLTDIRQASPLLRYQIFQSGRPLYERASGVFSQTLAQSFRQYREALPLYQLKRARL